MIYDEYELLEQVQVTSKVQKLVLTSFDKKEVEELYYKLCSKNKEKYYQIIRHCHIIDIIKDSKHPEYETKFME